MVTHFQSNLKVGEIIGSGYFGNVCLGNDDIHGNVAVKILHQQANEYGFQWKTRKPDLLAEGRQFLSQAAHDNVVEVYYLVESPKEDAVLLVMQYCPGGSLQEGFEAGPMPLPNVKKYATEITLGLQALHARDMLHRDIKPGNVLIDDRGIAKLGDFGLVTDDLILGYGSAVGYLDHLAPEVHAGSPTSARTDVWALGMTIYRLLHGAIWYLQSPPPALLIPDGGFANRLRWLPHIPKPWRRFVRKALNDHPGSRYQNATEVVDALASLPTEPRWLCNVRDSEVSWVREKANRLVRVLWTQHSQRRHDWRAWSEPLGNGRTRDLGGSNGTIGLTDVARQLQAFFST